MISAPLTSPSVHVINSRAEFLEMMEYLWNVDEEICVVDVETNSTSEKTAKLFGVGLCMQQHEAFYIPFRDNTGDGYFPSDAAENEVILHLVSFLSTKKLVGHNIIYDVLVLKNNWDANLTSCIYSDTILLKNMIDEERPHGLKETARKYLGEWAVKAQDDLYNEIELNGGSTSKDNCEMWRASTKTLGTYCGWDTIITLYLYRMFSPKLKAEGLEKLFYEDEIMPLYREVVIPMKDRGFDVDLGHFTKIRGEIIEDIAKLEAKIYTDIAEYIDKFERVELWKEFGVKRTGNFPRALAEYMRVNLPEKKGEIVLHKNLLKEMVPVTENDKIFYSWINGEDDIPKSMYPLATATHRMMWKEKYGEERIFNLNSTMHLSWLFFERLGIKPTEFTDTGKPKLDAEILDELSGQHVFATTIITFKKLQKLLSTYIDGILERQIDGVLYTSMLLFGTTSGRFASQNPNLNNLPAMKGEDSDLDPIIVKYTNSIRRGLIAPKGYKVIGCDFASLEPHIAAFVSGDPDLIDIFVNDKDFYSAIGIKQFNKTDASPFKEDANYFGKMYKDLRNIVKTYSLASFYGATAPRIADVLGKSREEAQELLNGYFESFPQVKHFIEGTHDQAMATGVVRTLFGRARHLYEAKTLVAKYGPRLVNWQWAKQKGLLEQRGKLKNLLNNSVNFQIQGYAAHVLNRAMLKMTRSFKEQNLDAWIALSIHDEVLVIAREEQVEQIKAMVKHSMETCVQMGDIKLKATPIIGNSYGECK